MEIFKEWKNEHIIADRSSYDETIDFLNARIFALENKLKEYVEQ